MFVTYGHYIRKIKTQKFWQISDLVNEDGYNFTFRLEWLDDSESIKAISSNNKLN